MLASLWVVLACVASSTAFAAGGWSAPDLVDPAIGVDSVSCSSSAFCVGVGYGGGNAGSAVVYNGSTWSEPSVIDPQYALLSVSCTSSSFCMAMDVTGGARVYNGSTWSAPTAAGADLTLVSCTSSSFCVATGGTGQMAVYNGSTWTAPSLIGLSQPSSISCASESFCMAVGSVNGGPGFAVAYDGSSWGAPTEIASGYNDPGASSVSCGSPTFCVAVGGNPGNEETYSNGTWSSTPIGNFSSVSCHSNSFCIATSPGGETVRYNGSTWSGAGHAAEGIGPGTVSCPTESFCMTAGDDASSYDGSVWTSPVALGSGSLDSVSCSSPSLCTAVDAHGRVLTYDGSEWRPPEPIAAEAEGSLTSISCPAAAGFCAAVGGRQHGYALTYDGAEWDVPTDVDDEGTMRSISCVSASFCVALAQQGREQSAASYALLYDGTRWSAPRAVDSHGVLRSVSCASRTFCLAVGGHEAAIYDGTSWSTPTVVDTEDNLTAVSCPSAFVCVAVAEHHTEAWTDADAITYNNGVWSTPTEIPRAPSRGGFDVGSISCPSLSFCIAGALFEGAGAIYEAGSWAPWTELAVNDGISSVSCPSASFCMVVDDSGQAFTYVSPTPHFRLAVSITGEGEVTSTPPGITCSTAECTYEPEGEVTLTVARAGAGYEFAGWIGCDRVSGMDCTVTAASKVTALFLKTTKESSPGKEGPAGREGATGNEGKPGATGPTGLQGATGTQGPTGAQGHAGPAGKIELVTCQTVKGKQHCTTKLVSGTVKFTTAGSSTKATLSRHGMVYAAGTAGLSRGRMSLRLTPLRKLQPGRYTLTLISGTGKHKRISRESVILR